VEHHRTTTSDRVVLERTLHGSIKAITDTLALVDPAGYARALRTREIVSTIAERVSAPDAWLIEIAAMLSQVASPALGTDREKRSGQMLTQTETSTVDRLAKIAEDVIVNIPRMGEIRAMLESRDLHYDGSAGRHDAPRELAIPLGGRILKIALDLDTLEVGGASRPEAVELLRGRDGRYDRELLDTLAWSGGPSVAAPIEAAVPAAARAAQARQAPPPRPAPPKLFEIELRKVQPGMMLDEDVCTVAGRVLIGRGEEATQDSIDQVKKTLNFEALRQIVRVRPPRATAADEAFSQQGQYRFTG
jgi:hypothetical protein